MLAPAFALVLWLVPLQLIGIWTHSFYFALYAAAFLAGAVGVFGWFHAVVELRDSPRWSRWLWLVAILGVGFMLPLEMLWTEHDEWTIASHTSIPREIQLGFYPPRHTLFVQFELKYHYGFDLCSSIFSLLFGQLDMWWSVHLLTMLLWGYAFCLFWAMGERWIGGRFAGPLGGTCVLLAGGMPYTCRKLEPLGSFMTGDCSTIGMWCLPPLISNGVQHPWSLGIPLSACALLVFHERRQQSGWWFLGLALVMALLSLAQVVAFGGLARELRGRRVSQRGPQRLAAGPGVRPRRCSASPWWRPCWREGCTGFSPRRPSRRGSSSSFIPSGSIRCWTGPSTTGSRSASCCHSASWDSPGSRPSASCSRCCWRGRS